MSVGVPTTGVCPSPAMLTPLAGTQRLVPNRFAITASRADSFAVDGDLSVGGNVNITTGALTDGSVTGADLEDGTVQSADLAIGAVALSCTNREGPTVGPGSYSTAVCVRRRDRDRWRVLWRGGIQQQRRQRPLGERLGMSGEQQYVDEGLREVLSCNALMPKTSAISPRRGEVPKAGQRSVPTLG